MSRKKWSANTEINPALIRFREKRKWQMALRRYVVNKNPSVFYAPYFGLDIENFRKWIEIQFKSNIGWEDFGKKWQFEHVVPIAYFDFLLEEELKLCWNFTNIRVEIIDENSEAGIGLSLLGTKIYFNTLFMHSKYRPCLNMIEKIDKLEQMEMANPIAQIAFLNEHCAHLAMIEKYTAHEFELINRGTNTADINKEIDFINKFNK